MERSKIPTSHIFSVSFSFKKNTHKLAHDNNARGDNNWGIPNVRVSHVYQGQLPVPTGFHCLTLLGQSSTAIVNPVVMCVSRKVFSIETPPRHQIPAPTPDPKLSNGRPEFWVSLRRVEAQQLPRHGYKSTSFHSRPRPTDKYKGRNGKGTDDLKNTEFKIQANRKAWLQIKTMKSLNGLVQKPPTKPSTFRTDRAWFRPPDTLFCVLTLTPTDFP